MQQISRRHFILSSAAIGASASVGLSTGALASTDLAMEYPIPTAPPATFVEFSSVVIPEEGTEYWTLSWEFSEDPNFLNVVSRDSIRYENMGEELIEVRLEKVPAGKRMYYRVFCGNCYTQEQGTELEQLKARQFVSLPNQEIASDAGVSAIDAVLERSY